jgi:hypothetical protein
MSGGHVMRMNRTNSRRGGHPFVTQLRVLAVGRTPGRCPTRSESISATTSSSAISRVLLCAIPFSWRAAWAPAYS